MGRVRSVPVEIHWLFLLLFLWAAIQGWDRGGLTGALSSAVLLALIFVCVLVHEIGHTVQAQALGIPVRRIVLLPVGGLAQLAYMPERPRDELRVALAGPAVNFGLTLVLGGLAWTWLLAGGEGAPRNMTLQLGLRAAPPTVFSTLVYLAFANLGILLFNLLPAFPMDGARILRSLLAFYLPRPAATRIVTWLGWLLGVALLAIGLGAARRWGAPAALGLLFVGVTAVFASSAEDSTEKSQRALRGISARAAVRQPTWFLSPTDLLSPALATCVATVGQSVLPVAVNGRVVGVLSRADLLAALKRFSETSVAHVMQTRFPYVGADEDLWQAQQLIAGAGVSALPVLDGGSLHGVLTAADIRAAYFEPPSPLRAEAPQLIPATRSNL